MAKVITDFLAKIMNNYIKILAIFTFNIQQNTKFNESWFWCETTLIQKEKPPRISVPD